MPSGHLLTREKSFALVNCFAWFYIGKIVVIELLKKTATDSIFGNHTTILSRLLTYEIFFQFQHLYVTFLSSLEIKWSFQVPLQFFN